MVKLDWRSVKWIGSQEEYEFFDRVVHEYANRFNRELFSLEIGSYHGQSTVLLAQYGWVLAIDLWGNVDNGIIHYDEIGQVNWTAFIQTIIRHSLIGRVFPVVSTSGALSMMPGVMFDLVYIDAAHDYASVTADIKHSVPHLSNGGLFVFHDYKRPGDNPELGVNKAVDELLSHGQFVVCEHFKGLLVLERIAT